MDAITTGQVATEVKVAMARQGFNQRRLSEEIDLSPAALSRRLSGEVEFGITELTAIAAALGVPLTDLLPSPALADERAS
jgi:transcriptional regulator with XRE-family HTH domain